jgi:uncharacterized membrane protein YbhN (UPF0104 family)
MRRWILLALKLGISGALLYWAVRSVDIAAVGGYFARIDPLWVALALAAFAVQIALAALRWSAIVRQLGGTLSAGRSFRYSMIAVFLNQALPSTVGGDAMRAWLLGRHDRRWRLAIYSVIVDRVVGVGFLAAIVALCLPWSLELVAAPAGRAAVLVIGVGGVAALPVVLLLGGFELGPRLGAWRVLRTAFEMAASVRAVLLGRSWLPIAALSVAIHFLTVGAAWSLARALALAPDALNFLILIPPVILISMVPISVGGWGIREGVMVVAFGYAGMEQSQALAVSVLLGGTMLILGAIGGIIWIAQRGHAPRAPTPDEPASEKTHA